MKRVIYCTISSANYLSRTLALKESVERHRRGADFRILLCEHPRTVRALEEELGLEFYGPDEIDCPQWRKMAFYYDCMEFNTAVKPYFLRTLLAEGADAVIYLDPDILLFSGMEACAPIPVVPTAQPAGDQQRSQEQGQDASHAVGIDTTH